jgi:hypothetical protein
MVQVVYEISFKTGKFILITFYLSNNFMLSQISFYIVLWLHNAIPG